MPINICGGSSIGRALGTEVREVVRSIRTLHTFIFIIGGFLTWFLIKFFLYFILLWLYFSLLKIQRLFFSVLQTFMRILCFRSGFFRYPIIYIVFQEAIKNKRTEAMTHSSIGQSSELIIRRLKVQVFLGQFLGR